MEATSTIELQAETLAGDIRDKVLDRIRLTPEPWTKLSEYQQRNIISEVTGLARDVIRGAIDIVAHAGFVHMHVATGEWTVKDGIKLKVSASSTVEDITKLAEHGGGPAILVFADPSEYFGQRAEVLVDKDQPDLPIHDDDGVIQEETVLDLKELATAEECEGVDAAESRDQGGDGQTESVVDQASTEGSTKRRRARAKPETPGEAMKASTAAGDAFLREHRTPPAGEPDFPDAPALPEAAEAV